MMKEKFRLKKLNNNGSALVVVVIVIAFITILATLILYLSVMNFHMKSNDYNTKVSFYGAEVPLEELRVAMALDFANACEKAYISVFERYGSLNDGSGTARKAEYVGEIMVELQDIWTTRGSDAAGISTMLNDAAGDSYHVISGTADTLKCADSSCTCSHHIILVAMPADPLNPGSSLPRLELDETTGKAVFKNVRSVYTENGFTSVIQTDFCFLIPEYDWSVEQSGGAWVDGSSTNERTKINYEKCVVYLNWLKQ